jgi:hypothetical protein
MQLYVDLDGVLADFHTGYEKAFGVRPCNHADNVDWDAVRYVPDFYLNLPPMPDMHILWTCIAGLKPIVLTGVPSSVPEAPANKRAWVVKNLGSDVEVRCCRSSEKYKHAAPGDILIDDWTKYRHLWEAAGGIWVTHTNARDTVFHLIKHNVALMRNIGRLDGTSYGDYRDYL